tara:strand:+ start:35 stop:529 length:495 start_codon:yes stop_codon:yes gene_type:complete
MDKYYNILDLKPGCSQDEIKKAYKKLAIKYHPDKQNDATQEEKAIAESKFKEIAEAYDFLMNPEKINNNSNLNKTHIDPNELFKHFFNMNIGAMQNPFSSRNHINGMNVGPGSANCVMRSSSISIINGQRVEKITETVNGVTSVKTIISGQPISNGQHIRINFN